MTKSEAKRALRLVAIQERRSLSPGQRRLKSRQIQRHLLRSSVVKKARVVAAYLSFGSEVDTTGLLHALWRLGKTVLVPVSSHGFKNSYFVVVNRGDSLKKTKFGPSEPIHPTKAFQFSMIDLVLVPGLAFDPAGARLGYGGGVYDRLLKKTPRAHHVGLFFSTQEVARLPVEATDVRLSSVVTERGLVGLDLPTK